MKFRMRILVSLIMTGMVLTACGSNGVEDLTSKPDSADASEITEDIVESTASEAADETIPAPETCEDYMKLADTYLQTDDVIQALAVLDEGIEKLSAGEQGAAEQEIDLLSQRKEYVLAGTVAVRTNLTENEYDDEGEILSGRVLECDENGNEIKDLYYDKGGEISRSEEYQYDADGNLIEYKYISYQSSENSDSSRQTWAYDENGNEIEYVSYDKYGNIERKTNSEYDAGGNQTKHTTYDENDEITGWTETAYDENGCEIKYEVYDKNGSCTRTITKEYDERRNLINYVIYDDDGELIEKSEYEYDKNDNRVKIVHYGDGVTISTKIEFGYDENGNETKYVAYTDSGRTISYWYEREYDENGNVIKHVGYDSEGVSDYIEEYGYDEGGRPIYENIDGAYPRMKEYEYDECGNKVKEIYTSYDPKTGQEEYKSRRWEKEYGEDGRDISAFFYDNEQTVSYQSKTEYDENGLIMNYTSYDENGDILGRRETEYDASGQVIKENYYDANAHLTQYYENEYDDFGSVIMQAMYEDGALKSEKQASYVYRYIGDIDTETADDIDNDKTSEEYYLAQREVLTRFLEGQEEVRYCSDFNSIEEGIVVTETITDLIDFESYKDVKGNLEYAFLDMTGDGIEELVIKCAYTNLYVIQSDYGILKVIFCAVGGNYGTYLVKYDGRIGVCCNFGGHVGANEEFYYFFDGKGKKEITLGDYQRFLEDGTESRGYCISDNDSFESRDISTGEYYDIVDKIVSANTIDWQRLEELNK